MSNNNISEGPLYTTQGGGTCEYVGDTAIWVEPPDGFGFRPGSAIPAG